MLVHSGPAVQVQRLGHEGGGKTVLLGDVSHNVLVPHELIGNVNEGSESEVNFALTGSANLVVVSFHVHANRSHEGTHVVSAILEGVEGSGWEISFLGSVLVGQVSSSFLSSGVPVRFSAVDRKAGLSHALLILHVIEQEEFGFRSDSGMVADSRVL